MSWLLLTLCAFPLPPSPYSMPALELAITTHWRGQC